MNRETQRRVQAIMRGLLSQQPFFASLALRMPLVESGQVESIAADGETIRYNPEWIATNSADDIRYAIAHVSMACALKHHLRRGERHNQIWQMASKLVTMPILHDANLAPVAGDYGDKTVEQVYALLEQAMPPQQQQPQGSAGQGDGDRGDGGLGAGGQSDIGQDRSEGGKQNQQDGAGEGGQGQPQPYTPPEVQGKGGEVQDCPNPGKAEEQDQDWDEAAHQAAQHAKNVGNLPGRAEETVRRLNRPTEMDWRGLLMRFLQQCAANDYSWNMPNRRFIDNGLYLPSLQANGLRSVAFIIDTSGSMDERELSMAWAGIHEALAQVETQEVRVIQCDTEVSKVDTYAPGEPLPAQLDAVGRGGTDFVPAFQEIDRMVQAPSAVLYFTDMGCHSYPDHAPQCPVLWLKTGDWGSTPPFGEVIKLPEVT